MKSTSDAISYQFAPDLWVITSYYNPCNYETRRRNYMAFAQALEASGLPLLTVECVFDGQSPTLPDRPGIVRVRSKSVVWQKERLLNLATSWLPRSCRYVAWLDCDLIFCNPAWARDTAALLESVPLVQVFEECVRLPNGNPTESHRWDVCRSFGAITPPNPDVLHSGRFDDHGHTGYGWAARRDLLDRTGLYEYAIAGSADHYMAHAAFGDIDGLCIQRMMGESKALIRHFGEWARPFADQITGKVAAVPGTVLHLWHGDLRNRKYLLRHREMAGLGFDPYTDLTAPTGKPLEWSKGCDKPSLKKMFTQYFAGRDEDGLAATA